MIDERSANPKAAASALRHALARVARHRGSILAVIGGQAVAALGLAAGTRVLTESATPAAMGEYKLAVGIVSLCSGLFFTPFIQFVMREYHDAAAHSHAAAFLAYARRSVLLGAAAASPAALVVLLVFGRSAGQPSPAAASAAVLLISLHAAFGLQNGVLITQNRQPAANAFRSTMQTAIPFSAAAGAILLGSHGVSLVAGELIALVTLYLVTSRLAGLPGAPIPTGLRIRWSSSARSFVTPLAGVGACAWVLAVSDRYILAAYQGAAEVGRYAAAYALGSQPILMLTGVAAQLLYPLLFSAAAGSRVHAQTDMLRYMALVTGTSAALSVAGVGLMGDRIIALLLAPEFREGARSVLLWVTAGHALLSVAGVLEMKGYASKRTAPMGIAYLCAAVTNLAANLVLIPAAGAVGAAKATFMGYLVYLLVMGLLHRRGHVRAADVTEAA